MYVFCSQAILFRPPKYAVVAFYQSVNIFPSLFLLTLPSLQEQIGSQKYVCFSSLDIVFHPQKCHVLVRLSQNIAADIAIIYVPSQRKSSILIDPKISFFCSKDIFSHKNMLEVHLNPLSIPVIIFSQSTLILLILPFYVIETNRVTKIFPFLQTIFLRPKNFHPV